MLTFTQAAATPMLDAFVTRAGAGAKIKFYSNPAPLDEYWALPLATEALTTDNVLLAVVPLANPIGTQIGNKQLLLQPVNSAGAVIANGVASFARIEDAAGQVLMQGSVGVHIGNNVGQTGDFYGFGFDFALSSVSFVQGNGINILKVIVAIP